VLNKEGDKKNRGLTWPETLLLFNPCSLIMGWMKIVSIVGMAGAGKSEVARVFEQNSFARIRFGDVTDEEMKKRGLEPNEDNERLVRELLRWEGRDAYARLNQPKIERALKSSNVVIDGLYSWEEYTYLKGLYGENLYLVAVWSSPRTRHARLAKRSSRRLTPEQAASRDKTELENLAKGGPIAMADFTIVNESSREELIKEAGRIVSLLK
jgi:dephospho-CoA kinase